MPAMKAFLLRFFFYCVLLIGLVPLAQAQDLGAIRQRMEQRIGQIDALKTQGVLGENNRGYLEIRSGDDHGVAAAENADRTVVYTSIAQKTGSSPAAVGQARARQIASASAPGVWVQNDNGQWTKK